MNVQPYQQPPKWWPSRLSPTFIRATRLWRHRDLQKQRIGAVDVRNGAAIRESLDAGAGVLLLPNHSFHYDSHVVVEAGLRHDWFTHFMTAWQVFAATNRYGKIGLQRHGCFSINREGTDTKAIRQAIEILKDGPHALVIFPEGDIYHSNDRVMPFREGAAAMALKAQQKGSRPIHIYPTCLKCFYTKDPTQELVEAMGRLEHRIRWRPRPDLPLLQRIYRFGEGFLSSKEIEYIGETRPGPLPQRIRALADDVLEQVRQRHELKPRGVDVVEQIRNVRHALIKKTQSVQNELTQLDGSTTSTKEERRTQLQLLEKLNHDMQDLFFVTQLSSYHGNYASEKPTVERIAETIDKFEEDVFELPCPNPRGERRAVIQFGDRIDLSSESFTPTELTKVCETRVQLLLNELNQEATHDFADHFRNDRETEASQPD